jgi:hypothetical protein
MYIGYVPLYNNKFWEELIPYFPWYDTGHIENDASNNSSIVACVFVTAVTFPPSRCLAKTRGYLRSRCLATIRGFLPSRCLATIRELLPSRCLATIGGYTDTHTHKHAHRQQRDLLSLPLFFKNKKSGLKTLSITCIVMLYFNALINLPRERYERSLQTQLVMHFLFPTIAMWLAHLGFLISLP